MATVDVWVAPLDVPRPLLARLVAGLSPDERLRAERYRSPDHRRRFAAGRGWLRHVLAAELGLAPADVRLAEGAGKPRLAGPGPCFSLSRSGELALVAVSATAVGVDLEQLDGGRALDAASIACTPAELAALGAMPPAERAEAFLQLWTAKEAFLKARGVGLAVAPDRVALGAAEPDGTVAVSGWCVRRFRPRPGYMAAVAAEGRQWDLAVRDGVLTPESVRG